MKRVTVGNAVKVVDEFGVEHDGLVTAVWGDPNGAVTFEYDDSKPVHCLINVTYVSNDPAKTDCYGRQLERNLTSTCHRSAAGGCPGRYWFQP